MKTFALKKLDDWNRVVKFIIPKLKPGTIIALSGPLGAGKTTFVQYLAKNLGVKSVPRSPTFSLIRKYKLYAKRSTLNALLHVDAYRIENERDLMPLNLEEELARPGTVAVIEWAEHIKNWLKKQPNPEIFLKIRVQQDESRIVVVGLDKKEK